MTTQYPLQLINAPQIIPIVGGAGGFNQLAVVFAAPPSAGTVTIEYRRLGGGPWQPLVKAAAVSMTDGYVNVRIDGQVSTVRVTFAGLVGGAGAAVWVDSEALPAGIASGNAAMIVQPYTEANVKNGLQFYVRANWPLTDTIAAAETVKMHFRTGAKPVIVKLRDFSYVAEELTIRLFVDPTGVTGGTPLTIHNYNAVSGVATTCVATKNVTTTADGAEIDGADPEVVFGSANAPQRSAAAIPVGRERILPPLTSFIVSITNTGSGQARAQYFLDWFEGRPDLPL
jgi:hypothetical protein